MMTKKQIKVLLSDGKVVDCEALFSNEPPWVLHFSGPELALGSYTGEDLFDALSNVREALEKMGAQILCAGAMPNAVASGMSRSMGGGRKAYVTRIGFPASREDLVDIFDYSPPENVGSIAEQRAFFEKWKAYFRAQQ